MTNSANECIDRKMKTLAIPWLPIGQATPLWDLRQLLDNAGDCGACIRTSIGAATVITNDMVRNTQCSALMTCAQDRYTSIAHTRIACERCLQRIDRRAQ
jgi:hypothetical protein